MDISDWHARISVLPKAELLDPQKQAITNALRQIGFHTLTQIHQGKLFDLVIKAPDKKQAYATLEAMCKQLLANPIMEDYKIEIFD